MRKLPIVSRPLFIEDSIRTRRFPVRAHIPSMKVSVTDADERFICRARSASCFATLAARRCTVATISTISSQIRSFIIVFLPAPPEWRFRDPVPVPIPIPRSGSDSEIRFRFRFRLPERGSRITDPDHGPKSRTRITDADHGPGARITDRITDPDHGSRTRITDPEPDRYAARSRSRSRCAHLRTAACEAPISSATSRWLRPVRDHRMALR